MKVKEETTTEVYSSVSDFPEDVKTLCHKSCDRYPFLSLSYYSTFECYVLNSQSRKPTYLIIRLNHQPVAMLPVHTHKKLCFTYCEALTNYYFFRYNLFMDSRAFTDDNAREAVFIELKNWLKPFSQINFKPVHTDNLEMLAFCDWMETQGWHQSKAETTVNWSTVISKPEDYFQNLPSQTRNTLKRTGKKLQPLGAEFKFYSNPDDIQTHFPEYWEIYQESWKPQETFPEFIEAITQTDSSLYQPLLGILYIDTTAVAAQLWFTQDKTAYIYKLAYRPAYKHLSVGTNLTWEMIKHCSEQWHIENINILNGNETYKHALFTQQQPVYDIQLHKSRFHTLARAFN